MKKKALSLALALIMCLGLTVPAFAAGTKETVPLNMVTVTIDNVLRKETITYSYEEMDYDFDTFQPISFGMTTKEYTVYIVSDGSFSFRISANPGQSIGGSAVPDCWLHFYDKTKDCFNTIDAAGDCFFDPSKIPASSSALKSHLSWALPEYPGRPIMYALGAYSLDDLNVREYVYVMEESTFAATKPKNVAQTLPTQPVGTQATPTNDKLTRDGEVQDPTVYKIDGSNYFKIRDLAAVLNGTEKQFSVGYDSEKNSVTATTGQGYNKLDTDLVGAPAGAETAQISNDAIYVNGQKVEAQVYKIAGSNYFKLRDLGKALDFYVGWTQEKGMFIETDKPYSE